MVFLANVAGRAWSGLESHCLLASETTRLDSSMGKKLRAMALGRAHAVSDDDAHRSWTTKRVFEYWSMAPTSIELL
eukprot:7684430-Pyramimonas_sp.AAC.1